MTGGAAAYDYDGDGFVDLYFTRMDGPDVLYRNQGDGTFAPVDPAVSGINRVSGSNGAVWGDIDNDGHADLYVTTVQENRNYLYMNNGDGTFTEQAISRGVDLESPSRFSGYSATLGDYDGDGYLDLYTTSWRDVGGSATALFRNQGATNPGHFDNVTVAAGVDTTGIVGYHGITNSTFGFAPRFTDLDRDGHVDLAIAGDFDTSRLFWNNGDGTFTDGTDAAGVGVDNNGMGSAIGDYNGDGLLDWFVSSIYDENIPNGAGWRGNGSQLYTNNGDRTFEAQAFDTHWGWGSTFFDYNNDGRLDLAVTNGFDIPDNITDIENDFNHNPTLLYENDGGDFFTGPNNDIVNDVAAAEGVLGADSGKGLLVLDFDNDGRLDLLVINNGGLPELYHNQSPLLHDWIGFDTVGVLSNTDGYGTWIEVTENGITQVFEVNAGSNFLGQNDKRAHFGLGDSDGILDYVSVAWPSGITQEFFNVPTNMYYTLNEISGLTPAYVPVPEPSTLVLAAFGLAALGARRFGRRRLRTGSIKTAVVALLACAAGGVSTARADVITDWNAVFTDTIRETATSHGPNAGPGPIARAGAMLFASMYDAVNSVDNTHQAYLVNLDVPSYTSREAAAATAAHRVLSSVYGTIAPAQLTSFNSTLSSQMTAIPDGPGKDAGIALGIAVADAMIAARTGDGLGVSVPYSLTPAAGYWQPAFAQTPITPSWGNLTPFAMTSNTQFQPQLPGGYTDMPSLLASPEYAAQVATVRELGRLDSTTRTAEQTEIAHFWANDDTGTYKPPGHLNEMTRVVAESQGNTLSENARLFALTNLAMADASIVAWNSKYLTDIDLWRPRDAIHEIYDDGNPLTTPDPTWQPLALLVNGSPAPAFPAYISGHATFAAAHAAVLAEFFGTDDISFELTSDDMPGVTRSFDSFSEAALENGISRVYLGVHYPWDSDIAYPVGQDLGHYLFNNYLQPLTVPVPEPSSLVLAAFGLSALAVGARRRVLRRRRQG